MSRALIDHWIAAETAIPGTTLAEALRNLSAETGRVVTHSRLREWQDGRQRLPLDVRRHMALAAGDRIIAALGLAMGDEEWDRMVGVVLG